MDTTPASPAGGAPSLQGAPPARASDQADRSATTRPAEAGPSRARRSVRLPSLDVVRGIAVCGILFANIGAILGIVVPWRGGSPPLSYTLEHLLIQERFFPIFSLLFGIGFGMIWRSASRRAAHPRLVLLRRLVSLLVLGALHQLLQPGEALLGYGIAGILVLLPATFVPVRMRARVALVVGAVLLLAAAAIGGIALIPGLFLVGFAVAELGVPARFDASARPGLLLAVIAGVLAIVPTVLQLRDPANAGFSAPSATAGLAGGMCLVGVVGAALHSPLRSALITCFAPLGRMALTNYVGATVISTLVGFAIFRPAVMRQDALEVGEGQMAAIWGCCVLLLVAQALVSRLWLARFGQGPLEKGWRWITWAGAAPRAAAWETSGDAGVSMETRTALAVAAGEEENHD